jgi:RNA polymerase sigma-70 factor, ECF subfamily
MSTEEKDVSVAQALPASTVAAATPPPRAPDFREVFEGHSQYVWNSLRRLGVHEADLEDLTHDVLITVYKRLADYDPARPLRPWLFGIAMRVAARYRQLARHRREVYDDSIEPVDEAPSVTDRMESREASELVIAALDTLGLDRKAVFVLHDIDGCAMPEIAATLDIPLNTAYSRLRLARVDFKRAVQRLRLQKGRKEIAP